MSFVLSVYMIVAATPYTRYKEYQYMGTYKTEVACGKAAKALNYDVYRCLPTE